MTAVGTRPGAVVVTVVVRTVRVVMTTPGGDFATGMREAGTSSSAGGPLRGNGGGGVGGSVSVTNCCLGVGADCTTPRWICTGPDGGAWDA